MKKSLSYIFCFLSLSVFSQGSGNMLDFSVNSAADNHILVGNLNEIATADFSVEMWLNIFPSTAGQSWNDPAIFSNKDWASGQNIGLNINVNADGKINVNIKGNGGSRKDVLCSDVVVNKGWFHFAATFSRSGNLTAFINGVQFSQTDISAAAGSLAGSYPFRIAQDGTGAYSELAKFNGQMDEFRLWQGIIPLNQIRSNMCRKISGTESGLILCYRMDETSGITINDLGPNNYDGQLQNSVSANRKISAAPIGDISTFAYPAGAQWFGTSLTITDTLGSVHTVGGVDGNPDGVQLYAVNENPNTSAGLFTFNGINPYVGVFPVNTTQTQYIYTNSYAANSQALPVENNISLHSRSANNGTEWALTIHTLNTTANSLNIGQMGERRELILSRKPSSNCNPPTNILLSGTTIASADVQWTTGGASHWNVAWAVQGAELSSLIPVNYLNVDSFTMSGLTPNTYYDFYVQDSCASTSSVWVGPFRVRANDCSPVSLPLNITNITTNGYTVSWSAGSASAWSIEWGITGFTPGTGIIVNVASPTYTFTGLASNTTYDIYVTSICGSFFTQPAGPVTTTTLNNTSVEKPADDQLIVFPNPTSGYLFIQSDIEPEFIKIYAVNGQCIRTLKNSNQKSVDISDLDNGLYIVEVKLLSGSLKRYKTVLSR